MGQLAGILRTEDTAPVAGIAPDEVGNAVNDLLARYVAERNAWQDFLVAGETTNPKQLYKLGGIDEGQEIGPDGRPLETRPTGQVDVAFPLKRIGWAMGWNYETQAYMTVADLERNVASQQGGNAKRHMREQFRAVFNKDNYTVTDPRHGSLTIRRLANSDGTTYPPSLSSDAEADDNHYLVSGYAATAMSAANNPFATLKAEIVEHFSSVTAVVAIVNPAQRAEIVTDIPNFVDAPTAGIQVGSGTATASAVDGSNVPATFLGIEGDSGVFVYVDDSGRIPANYVYAQAVGAPAPLLRRVPEAAALQGFKLEADEAHYPLFKRSYLDRFGYGVANRLSAAVMFLDAGGTFTNPAIYA